MSRLLWAVLTLLLAACGPAKTDLPILHIATASNFRPTLERLTADFPAQCGAQARLSAGSTGHLAAQILNGAPYDVFIAAGSAVPDALAQKGVIKSRTAFAVGALVYWTPEPMPIKDGVLALARPEIAPYGKAAQQAITYMEATSDWRLPPKRVMGKSAAQAFSFVATGAANAGLVPLSLTIEAGIASTQIRAVPDDWYDKVPNAVLVLRQSELAACFIANLRSPKTALVLREAGFEPL